METLRPGFVGPDVQEFPPERWPEMNDRVEFPVGIYDDLHGGARRIPKEALSIDFSFTQSSILRRCQELYRMAIRVRQ